MKKVLAGCLIVIVIAIFGFGVVAFYAYRAMKPVIDNASNYMDKAREITRLGDEIKIKTPYKPPATSELTTTQVERFLAVQTRVRSDLNDQWEQIEKKTAEIKAKADANRQDWTLSEVASQRAQCPAVFRRGIRVGADAYLRSCRCAAGRRDGPFEDRRPRPRECR